ncbi:serine/threonine-protein kinase [Actinomadura rupiterrae]|uniref:serine/threonine-protein kinase n=1 Tax=Actinomadura rupiterrae TaxID=559627 RepID=UPI0020A25BE5|nr:serine/threonine-protein kinase [Actinomadura rupiterrae]MCP2336436.1 hypothetical protein [Actinomadura rupiterrae]
MAGRYRLVELLGRGGMGEVWRALDLTLDRSVAVKVLLGGRSQDEALARFRVEAKAAARLDHPRIALLYDIAEHGGLPFLVLALLPGPDLAAELDAHQGGLPVERVLEYGAQAAEGLAAAHAAGVIHRDVKPSNLMLDGNGGIKICDFGIARLEDGSMRLTPSNGVLGTLAYMPPEQVYGEKVDASADVYALGATLFHLLTGRTPYVGPAHTIVTRHLRGEKPPALGSVRPDIPTALGDYVASLLAPDPARRPSAQSIPATLRSFTGAAERPHPRFRVLVDDAERIARSTSHPEAELLATIASLVGGSEPQRARILLADAERAARSVSNPRDRAWTLTKVAKAVTGSAPSRARALLREAERTALFLDPDPQISIFGPIAAAMAVIDPSEAQRMARAIPAPHATALAMADVIGQMALTDAVGAERIARALPETDGPARSLTAVAEAVAATNPAEAERIARSIPDLIPRAQALAKVVTVMAAGDPAHARALLADAEHSVRTATHLGDIGYTADVLAVAMAAMAAADPSRAGALLSKAEGIARTIPTPFARMRASAAVAAAVAPALPAEAERIARAVPEGALFGRAEALEMVAGAVAKAHPIEGERIARSVDERARPWALNAVAEALAGTDPVEAERIARTIRIPSVRAMALLAIAREMAPDGR